MIPHLLVQHETPQRTKAAVPDSLNGSSADGSCHMVITVDLSCSEHSQTSSAAAPKTGAEELTWTLQVRQKPTGFYRMTAPDCLVIG